MLSFQRFKRTIGSAAAVDQTLAYLIREASIRLPGPLHGTRIMATYTMKGKSFQIEHGTHDTTIFRELFWEGVYDLPSSIRELQYTESPSVLDLGGNVGYFALWLSLALPSAQLIAFEPDPANAVRYREMLKQLDRPDWTVVEAYASAQDGEVTFATGRQAIGTRTIGGNHGTQVRSVDVLPAMESADFVKMDIEGAEWEILCDPRFATSCANVIVMEYHRAFCPETDYLGMVQSLCGKASLSTQLIFHSEERGLGMLWAYDCSER